MKGLRLSIVLLLISHCSIAQDLISGGANSWIFHTPDDGRTMLSIAPKVNGSWDFSKRILFESNGEISASGLIEAYSSSSGNMLDLLRLSNSNGNYLGGSSILFTTGAQNTARIGTQRTNSGTNGDGDLIFYTQNGGSMTEKLRLKDDGKINFSGTLYKKISSPGSIDPALLSAYSEHTTNGGELPIISLGFSQGITSGTDMDTKIWSYARNVSESRNFITIGRRRIDLSSEKVYLDGNLGIGISSPTEKLEVDGMIKSEEVKVEILAGTAPDYVFSPDYQLSTLEETAAYIEENHHLPEIPSAAEIEANGVELGEMNMLLLKKIEELTLHVIELKKEVETLKSIKDE
ncbi:hypothetical protein [Reichenbachiella ulvae]|uniref:Chaperone of endosialidase n=1 Tax=Reichenbachiella ulvae TaxID=2980104 RepID=A0ABT3CV94_9BACT|nr:hypothetical protein [Reichenbachiella ulvae]MCV9387444.1 hypothetical protein [Reichenbachiella ulvae]